MDAVPGAPSLARATGSDFLRKERAIGAEQLVFIEGSSSNSGQRASSLKGNLYKVWNRMSSGSYHPPPVRLVEIPKDNGGTRPLGIPTIADRVAQTVGSGIA